MGSVRRYLLIYIYIYIYIANTQYCVYGVGTVPVQTDTVPFLFIMKKTKKKNNKK